jgi:hypothetical protein
VTTKGDDAVVYFGEPIRSGYVLVRPSRTTGRTGRHPLQGLGLRPPDLRLNLRIDRDQATYGDLPQPKSAQESRSRAPAVRVAL